MNLRLDSFSKLFNKKMKPAKRCPSSPSLHTLAKKKSTSCKKASSKVQASPHHTNSNDEEFLKILRKLHVSSPLSYRSHSESKKKTPLSFDSSNHEYLKTKNKKIKHNINNSKRHTPEISPTSPYTPRIRHEESGHRSPFIEKLAKPTRFTSNRKVHIHKPIPKYPEPFIDFSSSSDPIETANIDTTTQTQTASTSSSTNPVEESNPLYGRTISKESIRKFLSQMNHVLNTDDNSSTITLSDLLNSEMAKEGDMKDVGPFLDLIVDYYNTVTAKAVNLDDLDSISQMYDSSDGGPGSGRQRRPSTPSFSMWSSDKDSLKTNSKNLYNSGENIERPHSPLPEEMDSNSTDE